jgi:DNA invertase Pin-like site-specific DNA recombinase
VSGSKDRRPALDALIADARRRRFGVLVCWRLDRLGRNLRGNWCDHKPKG